MKNRHGAFVFLVMIAMLSVWTIAEPVQAQDRETMKKTDDGKSKISEKLNLGNARAIVVAKLKEDKPTNGPWRCRLIHSDPNLSATDPFERHIGNREFLLLVNLSDETVTFDFMGAFFDEGAGPFEIAPDNIEMLTVKERVQVKKGDPDSVFSVTADGHCFDHLPGPFVMIP